MFKTIGTTTDSQINAGTYQIILSGLPNVSFDYLEDVYKRQAINDSVVVDDLDLWAEAGFAGACKKVVDVKVKGGLLTISFPRCV